jgi:hypothetical protein
MRVYQTELFTGPDAEEKRRAKRHNTVFPPKEGRLDISDLMKTIQSKGIPQSPAHLQTRSLMALTNDEKGLRRISPSQAEVMWDELKEERSALTAIVLEKFWPQFAPFASERLKHYIKQYKPSGKKSLAAPNIAASFENMLGHYIAVEKQGSVQGQKKSMKQFLTRLEAITDFGFEYKRWFGGPGKVQHFILRGFNTARGMLNALMMIGVTQLLARGIPCTKKNLEKYIRANMRHVTMSASTNIEHGPLMANVFDDEAIGLMKSLGCDHSLKQVRHPSSALHNFSFNEKTFELVPKVALYEYSTGDSYYGIPPSIGDVLPRGKTIGCPARYVRFLFKQLGEIYVDMTAQLLRKKYENDQAKIIALRTMFEGI